MAVNSVVSSGYGMGGAAGAADASARLASDERLRSAGDERAASPLAANRDQREFDRQQQALVQGVLAVFEPVSGVAPTSTTGGEGQGDPFANKAKIVPSPSESNPQIEQAILKFMHALFNVLREFDTAGTYEVPAETDALAGIGTNFGSFDEGVPSPLASQLNALAQRYDRALQAVASADVSDLPDAEAVTEATVAAAASGAAEPSVGETDAQLTSAYAEVLAALQGDVAGAAESSRESSQADLSALLQRLSQAMQSSPAFGVGLPTRGTFLSARA